MKANDPVFPDEQRFGLSKYEYLLAAALTGICAGTIKYRPTEAVECAAKIAEAAIVHLQTKPNA